MDSSRQRLFLSIILLIIAFAITACTTPGKREGERLPVYQVSKSGVDRSLATELGKSLGIDISIIENKDFLRDGGVKFIDEKRYQYVPTKQLGEGKSNEDKGTVIKEAFDVDAIKDMTVLDKKEAYQRLSQALKTLKLYPKQSKPRVSHSRLTMVDIKGKTIVAAKLDTQIGLDLYIDKIPLEGPGAKINATFDSTVNVTRLHYAHRDLRPGEKVRIITTKEAVKRCRSLYQGADIKKQDSNLKIKTRLLYYAPSLSIRSVDTILPFYECSGTVVFKERESSLLQYLIPATDDNKYVPSIRLEATVKDANVNANVDIKGGKPPYTIKWSSPSRLLKASEDKIAYKVASREGKTNEVITVHVTDSNGVVVSANKTLTIEPAADVSVVGEIQPKVAGVVDYGTENAVTNQFGDLESGFIIFMQLNSITERFSWSGTNAWEQDFKATTDSDWVDNTDITLYVGHGDGDGFTFEDTTHTDDKLDYNDADGDWGDKDLEWLALYSCQVLEETWGGMNRFDRWAQEFDGLHLLLGFETNARVNDNFTGAFAFNMLGMPLAWWHNAMKVRAAWFEAINDFQPSDRVGVVMGVFRTGDYVTNYNDYFHGKGSVGPDIRGSSIGGYWWVDSEGGIDIELTP